MKVEYRDGLLFTTIEIMQDGKRKEIDNIVIDTGASHTVISQGCVDDIGIGFTCKEEIVTSYGVGGKEHAFIKQVDEIKIGKSKFIDFKLDFCGQIYEDINGLLGLDILLEAGFIIDLNTLVIYQEER